MNENAEELDYREYFDYLAVIENKDICAKRVQNLIKFIK